MSATEDKVHALLQQAADGAKSVFTSERYLQYLTAMAKFHQYSARNVLLILMQMPHASRVAGYQTWKKEFGRHVKQGEKGLAILGYAPYRKTVDVPATDTAGHPLYDPKGNPLTRQETRLIPAFKPMYVFDVSQTEGEPLPKMTSYLSGPLADYSLYVSVLTSLAPVPVSFEAISSGANGYFSRAEQRIAIRQGMSERQTIKTLVHEIAHAQMHNVDAPKQTRQSIEIEAESMAFIICAHLGLDSSDYSFPYIAGWASSQDISELQASMDRIQKSATRLIEELDGALDAARSPEQSHAEITAQPSLQQTLTLARQAAAGLNAAVPDHSVVCTKEGITL